jgi:glycosyltransferase involved in cell wall biosynthesis
MTTARVLMVAYAFPPMSGSGVYRTAKFAKYLPHFGWNPVVVCGDDGTPFGLSVDPSLLADVPPEARVLRTRFVSPYGLRRRLKRLLRLSGKENDCDQAVGAQCSGTPSGLPARGVAQRTLKWFGRVLRPLESPPVDLALYWALSIVPLCRRLIAEENVGVIYTSSDPYSDHLVGWMLRRQTGKPWVADFRDPWTQAWNYNQRGWRSAVDRRMERHVLDGADRIIGVAPGEVLGLQALSSQRDPNRFITIENGFDPEDSAHDLAPGIRAQTPAGKTVLAFVGTGHGTLVPILEALARVGPAMEAVRLRLVGSLAPAVLAWLQDHAGAIDVELVGRVPHAEAIGHMRAADILLLPFGASSRWADVYSGKLFEYMAAGRPILLGGPVGDASRLLEASGTGVRLPLERPDEAAAMLGLLASDPAGFRALYYHPDAQIVAQYERRALTGRLAALFDELAGPGNQR